MEEIIAFIANRVRPKSSTALSVLQERQARKSFIRTGVEELDLKLKGGLLIGSISEICGPPGMGKSQFCMSCIVQAIDPVKETSGQIMTENMNEDAGGAIYIDTELKFDPARLVQIAVARMPRQYSTKYRTDAEHEVDKLLQKVLVRFNTVVGRRLVFCLYSFY